MNTLPKEDAVTLEILESIENQRDLSQRDLADRLGIALGLTNSYLKRCARKGLVKIQQAPANRYFYYLTPKGFAEKSKLTASYFSHSLVFYRKAGEDCRAIFEECKRNRKTRVLLCGVSELAEIAFLRAKENGVTVVAIYDPDSDLIRFQGKQVLNSLQHDLKYDFCLITTTDRPADMYGYVHNQVGIEKVFVPEILGLSI